MKNVVIGFLGSQLDSGAGAVRWEKWRPTVSMCQHEDLLIDRLELLHSRPHTKLAGQVKEDIASVSPETDVRLHLETPAIRGISRRSTASCMTSRAPTGSNRRASDISCTSPPARTSRRSACSCSLSRATSRRLLQTAPPRSRTATPGSYSVIDLDLSRYDQIAARFASEERRRAHFLKIGHPHAQRGLQRMIEEIERVAVRSRAPILLTGPTGAGKSQLARACSS